MQMTFGFPSLLEVNADVVVHIVEEAVTYLDFYFEGCLGSSRTPSLVLLENTIQTLD